MKCEYIYVTFETDMEAVLVESVVNFLGALMQCSIKR